MRLVVVLERDGALAPLRTMAPDARRAIKRALAGLAATPYPPGHRGDVRRLDVPGSGEPVYRIRIGDYRAAYIVRPPQIRVLRIFHRSEGYGWLARLGLD